MAAFFKKWWGMGETHNGLFSAPVSAALVSVALIGFSLSFVGGQTSAVYWQFLKVGRLKRHGTRAMRSSAGGAGNLF